MAGDDQLIERIASAMRLEVDGVSPSAALLERIVLESGVRSRRRFAGVGALVPALSGVAAVAIAVFAVAALNHRARGSASGRAAPAARGLVANLAVLRRPQHPDDRLPTWAARQALDFPGHGRLVDSLSRLVSARFNLTEAAGSVYLVVQTTAVAGRAPAIQHPLLRPSLGDQASVVIAANHRASTAALGEPASALRHPAQELLLQGFTQGGPGDVRRLGELAAGIVPDGVTRVVWRFADGVVVHPLVSANTAIAVVPVASGILTRSVWYGSGRRVLASFTDPLVRGFGAALAQSDREPVAPALRRHFAMLRSSADYAAQLTGAGLTAGVERALIEPANPYGLNLAAARFVPYPSTPTASPNGPAGLWVVPGRAGVALLSDSLRVSGTWGLSGLESPLSGRMRLATWYGDGSQTIVGLVPDGNTRVTVLVRGGRRVSAPVVYNVYSIYVPPHPVALLVRNAAGRTVRIPFTGD